MAKTNAELQAEVTKLKEELVIVIDANEVMASQLDNVAAGYIITRNDIIKAMLPQIRLVHARPDTQQLMRSVDEVLEAINA